MATALIYSNNFIRKSLRENAHLSSMKLQKMLYFAYRDYYRQNEKPLFSERFSTWRYGPVIEAVYHEFKGFGTNSITCFYRNIDGVVQVYEDITGEIEAILGAVWGKYKNYKGSELSKMTHMPGSAWSKAHENHQPYLLDEDIKNDICG